MDKDKLNIAEAQELVKKYRALTVEKVRELVKDCAKLKTKHAQIRVAGHDVMGMYSGMGSALTCSLCAGAKKKSGQPNVGIEGIPFWNYCPNCIYAVVPTSFGSRHCVNNYGIEIAGDTLENTFATMHRFLLKRGKFEADEKAIQEFLDVVRKRADQIEAILTYIENGGKSW